VHESRENPGQPRWASHWRGARATVPSWSCNAGVRPATVSVPNMAWPNWLRTAANSTWGEGVSSLCGVPAADAARRAACSAADTAALVWMAQRPASMAAKKHRKKGGATKANSTVACPLPADARRRRIPPPTRQWYALWGRLHIGSRRGQWGTTMKLRSSAWSEPTVTRFAGVSLRGSTSVIQPPLREYSRT
jgi:hypothetical protein